MGRRQGAKQVSADSRTAIQALVEAGHSNRFAADHIGVPLGTVARIACRVRSEGTAAARHRPGRPLLVDIRASRRLQLIIRHHLWSLGHVTEDYNLGLALPVSTRTVRLCFHRMCTSNYAAVTQPFLKPAQVRQRLRCVRDKVPWPPSAW